MADFWWIIPVVLVIGALILSSRLALTVSGWFLRLTFVRLRYHGVEQLPASGAVLLVSNHISMIDMILLQTISHRRIRFMMSREVLSYLPARFIFNCLGIIEVPSPRRPRELSKYIEEVRSRLRKGEVLCFFPEGAISGNGNLMRFRSGVSQLIPNGVETLVLPVRIGMLHGRLLSRYRDKWHFSMLTTWPLDISINIGAPVDPQLSAYMLRQRISELGAEAEMVPQPRELPLHTAFLYHTKFCPLGRIYVDYGATGKQYNLETLIKSIVLSKLLRRRQSDSIYIGVLLPNSTAAVSVIMATWFADRTPAMINYSVGAEVALESARRAGISLILTSRKFLEKLKWEASPEMLCLEDLAPEVTSGLKFRTLLQTLLLPRRLLARTLAPLSCFNVQRQAVLLFSSGSTGHPKAVMLTHRNINSDIYSFIRVITRTRRDRLVGNLPVFHAYGFTIGIAFPAQGHNMAIFVMNPLDAASVVKSVAEYSATILMATPTFLQNYMRKAHAEDFKTLRLMITGAEKLRPELAQRYHDTFGRDIIEGYGCTELSPIVTVNLNNSIFELGTRADHPGSIGCPLPSIHIRIVDQDTGVELEPGNSGRMQVKGGIVMKGYFKDPEQTARVIQNGFYDTGDIAYQDRDGYVYITGRASRFSKIGGEMVPHEGVEAEIMTIRQREVREVAVTGCGDARKGEKLVVFYTAEDFDPDAIIEAMRHRKLPNLWIPKRENFVHIAELPILGSGKLNLRKLKELAEQYDHE